MLRDKLVVLWHIRLREIAVSISSAASHAGRTTPCYFDVERTLKQLGVHGQELRKVRSAVDQAQAQGPIVKFPMFDTPDEEYHLSPQLDINQERGMRSGRHIPKFLPPFPSVHTYRNTMMDMYTDRNYVSQREKLAQHRMSTQKALNGYYVRTQPTMSLFTEPQNGSEFLVLTLKKPKEPAYQSALMPRDEIFDVDIYEFNEQPNEKSKVSIYLKEPQLVSTRPSVPTEDEDLGFKPNVMAVVEEAEGGESIREIISDVEDMVKVERELEDELTLEAEGAVQGTLPELSLQ
ncbi:hypothetical protein KR222_002468 [Zaprionus bogoriensis]|nr:hypothetical protein KR222_002468 [Zaprionus bogoriensis]